MNIKKILLKSGVVMNVDEGYESSYVLMMDIEEYDIEVKTDDGYRWAPQTRRRKKVECLKFKSNGEVWVIKESEVAGLSYGEEEERPAYKTFKNI